MRKTLLLRRGGLPQNVMLHVTLLLAGALLGACTDLDTPQPGDSQAAVDSTPLMGFMHDPTCGQGRTRTDGNAGTVGTVTDTAILRGLRVDCLRRSITTGMAAKALMASGQMMLSIPEYHDEQAFPISATEFGPVALFFASPFLGGFNHRWQIEEHGSRGMVAGILVVVDSSGSPTLPDRYVRLKLKAGVNCVWVAHSAGTWTSYISQPKPDSACAETDKRDTLAVIAYQHSVFRAPADYPPVVRFSEDGDPVTKLPRPVPGAGQPLLGVRCANYWCEIGPRDPAGRPMFALSRPGSDTTTREGGIKGWHDEQWLAIGDANGILRPGFRAVIVPARNIADRSASFFQGTTFVRSATIDLPNAPPPGSKYEQLGFRRGSNVLAFRHQGGVWESQLVSSAGTFTPTLFDRVQHFDAAVPGTARFRWNVMDDGAWAACGQACCRIAAIQ